MVEVRGMTAHDGDLAIRDVTLAIERGSLFVVLGPAGAGKTTLLRILAGQIAPLKGTVRIGGADPSRRRIESVDAPQFDVERIVRRNPDLVLLDEGGVPVPGHDPYRSLREIHRVTASGITVVAVLRDIDAAAHFADRVALVRHGRVVAHGEPAVVLQPLLLAHVFGFRCGLRRAVLRPQPPSKPFPLGSAGPWPA